MKKIIFIGVVILFLFSCKEEQTPEYDAEAYESLLEKMEYNTIQLSSDSIPTVFKLDQLNTGFKNTKFTTESLYFNINIDCYNEQKELKGDVLSGFFIKHNPAELTKHYLRLGLTEKDLFYDDRQVAIVVSENCDFFYVFLSTIPIKGVFKWEIKD